MHTSSELPPAFFTLALFTSPWCRRRRHTTRYYAFISKYLDSTDLLLLFVVLPLPPPFLRALLAFYRFASLTAHTSPVRCPSALVFPSHTHTHYPSPALTRFFFYTALFSLAPSASLRSSLLFGARALLPHPNTLSQHFALANLEPRWRRLHKFLIRNILPAPEGHFQTPTFRRSYVEAATKTEHENDTGLERLMLQFQTAVVSSSNLSTSSLPAQLAQLTTTPETLIETNQLNYPS